MTTWKDGGPHGSYLHEVTDETGRQSICHVRTRCNKYTEDGNLHKWTIVPWPEGEANFRLILKAPEMLAALCSIRDKLECYLQPLADCQSVSRARLEAVRDQAIAAITATKGEGNDSIG